MLSDQAVGRGTTIEGRMLENVWNLAVWSKGTFELRAQSNPQKKKEVNYHDGDQVLVAYGK